MRLRVIAIVVVLIVGLGLLRIANSQGNGSTVPADCKNKQAVQYRSSGAFTGSGTSEVKCTVDYWICDKPFSQSKVVRNQAGACDQFRDSVVASLPKEVCCDCYPNCASDTGPEPQKQDCCHDVQQLKDQVKQLEDRVKKLEEKLNGNDIVIGSGPSNIHISNTGDNQGVTINSNGPISINSSGKSVTISSNGAVSIKAAGIVSLKGSKVTQN